MTSPVITDFTLSTDDVPNFTTSETGGGVLTPWVWSRLDWDWVQVVQLLFGCVGVIGNLLVILVLLRQKAYKHTVDIMIGALAVFIIPVPLAVQVPDTFLGVVYCKCVFPDRLFYIAITASIYTLVGITIQRFIAVVFPIQLGWLVTKRRVYIYLVAVWVFAAASVSMNLRNRVRNSKCTTELSHTYYTVYVWYMLSLRIIIPSAIMITTQIITAKALHHQSIAMRHARSIGEAGDRSPLRSSHITARNNVVKLMFIVVFICLVSIAPNTIAQSVLLLRRQLYLFFSSPVYAFLRLLALINFCANPFIYAARFPRFRAAVLEMLTCEGKGKNAPIFDHEEIQASNLHTDANGMSKSVSTISQNV